jgi:peptidyl-tRNA hydrolase ICT1
MNNFSIFKRFYASKPWSYTEATKWQQSFNQQKIPKEHVTISFSRSSGPGGQNVNKGIEKAQTERDNLHGTEICLSRIVSTKVDLRLSLTKASWLPDYAKEKLKSASQLRKSKNEELIITSDKTRSQAKNIQDCYEKLVQVIKESVAVTKEPDLATLARVEQL